MSQITITINSREYPVACEDGQELRIMQLADVLDEKAKQLAGDAGQISESLLLAMVGLLLADELSELKKGNMSKDDDSSRRINTADMSKLDGEIAAAVQNIDSEIKKLAKQLSSL
ncbi:MAG: cell division protein ZapA [Alphaproteobacteria bacterium]|nr:cell division protein ZapA [Alphaproteobacteria bacterium]